MLNFTTNPAGKRASVWRKKDVPLGRPFHVPKSVPKETNDDTFRHVKRTFQGRPLEPKLALKGTSLGRYKKGVTKRMYMERLKNLNWPWRERH